MQRLLAPVLCLAAFVACRQPDSKAAAAGGRGGETLVARFGELEITAADVDARILNLPPAERPQPGEDLDAWYEEQIRELAVEHRLRAEAEENDLAADEAFLAARREAEKQFAVQLCLAELRPQIEQIPEEELRAAYEARSEAFAAPERRAVLHLFLRRAPEVPPAAARAEIETLRDRVLAGESFQRLAAAHSDSESRHSEGALGWVTPGQLPAGFEEVIFRLDEGVPSEPVATRDGFHLFYVDQILPARRLTFDEARAALHAQLVAERREAALAELEAEAETPPGSIVLDRDGFAAVAQAGDPDAAVLSIGDFELTLGGLRRQVRQTLARQGSARPGAAAPPPTVELAWRVLEGFRRRELVERHCRAHGKVSATELENRLDAWQRNALVRAERQRRLAELAGRDGERLRLFYESNVGRFSKPPRWHLRRLRIPLGDDARAVMARLEEAARPALARPGAARPGEARPGAARPGSALAELHAELGGEIDDLGFKSLAEVSLVQQKLPPLVAPLAAGELSAPYRTESTLEIVEVLARAEAEPLPFDEVRDLAAAAYVQQYTHELYRELADEILQTAELQILPEGLAALRQAGLPQRDVSVEELEELLNEL